jgi:hypothetical protein
VIYVVFSSKNRGNVAKKRITSAILKGIVLFLQDFVCKPGAGLYKLTAGLYKPAAGLKTVQFKNSHEIDFLLHLLHDLLYRAIVQLFNECSKPCFATFCYILLHRTVASGMAG